MQKLSRVVLIPGHGIGPEITEACVAVLKAAAVPLELVRFDLPQRGDPLTPQLLALIRRDGVALKGPIGTPIGKGYESVNVRLRKELGLYAGVRSVQSLPGVRTPFTNVDLVVIRENLEDLYSGIEGKSSEAGMLGRKAPAQSLVALKVVSRAASRRIAEFAFSYAKSHGRKKVTVIHKANILKRTDGLFLDATRRVAKRVPKILFEELIVDNAAQQFVLRPSRFDIVLCPNLYGDILSDLAAALVGGIGLAPSGQFGKHIAVFEPVHGTAPDIAGKGMANPTAMILSAVLMLQHLGLVSYAERIERAVKKVLASGRVRTRDLGGKASTSSFTAAVIRAL